MGNRFVTTGLSSEATHGTRDFSIRKTGTGRRPSEVELTAEPVDTKSPKSSESCSNNDNIIIFAFFYCKRKFSLAGGRGTAWLKSGTSREIQDG